MTQPQPGPVPVPPYTMAPPASGATTRRSPWLLGVVAAVALAAAIANFVGMLGFPFNAPVEWLFAAGICIDLAAIAIACGVGAALAARTSFRPGSNAIAVLALVFAGLTLVIWAVAGGVSSIMQLLTERGRHMDAIGGLFLTGGFWAVAAIFAAHTVRRGEGGRRRLFAILALTIVGLLAAYAAFSSLIYGMGLTD